MRRVLHLVRAHEGHEPLAVAEGDWIVYLADGPLLAPRGAPPLPAGPISHDQLVVLVFAADLVVTW